MELNIISIEAVDQVLLPPAEQMPEKHPELGTLKFLPAGAEPSACIGRT